MEVVNYVMLWPDKWMKNMKPISEIEEKVGTVYEKEHTHMEINSCQQIPLQPTVDVHIYKEIGKLENRMDSLEQRIKELEQEGE